MNYRSLNKRIVSCTQACLLVLFSAVPIYEAASYSQSAYYSQGTYYSQGYYETVYQSTYSGTHTTSGLMGYYYNGSSFDTYSGSYLDLVVDFSDTTDELGSARARGTNTFSVRWIGEVYADYTQTYTFYAQHDDGVRIWVDQELVVNDWNVGGSAEHSGTKALTAGTWYPITVDYYQNTGSGVMQLKFSSASESKKIIPSSNLRTNRSDPVDSTTLTGIVKFEQDLDVSGNVAKGGGSFVIDHPQDPENKLLYHSFVESPDVKNIYDGIVDLDQKGEATVALPDYFEALNHEYRYQYQAIGQSAPGLYIKKEIANNQFTIAGGPAGARVSWQVTGNRKDPYILANPIIPEVEKGPDALVDKGEYLFEGYER